MVKLLIKQTKEAVILLLYKGSSFSSTEIEVLLTYGCFLKHVTKKPKATTDYRYIHIYNVYIYIIC